MSRPSEQEIKCNVKNCKYNDKVKYCTLSDITIGQQCSCATDKCQTDCLSFEAE